MKRSVKLINKAVEEEQREYFYKIWLVRYPEYNEDNYESFEEFYDKYKPKKIVQDNETKDEIMEEILSITPQGRND